MPSHAPRPERPRRSLEPLPAGLAEDLARPEGVEWRQTHLSHVFLGADRVVKVRKAVELSFVSFGSRAARNRDCLDEVALNRRLAPDVYLGVAPLLRRGSRFAVGPVSEELRGDDWEHAVVMRRLPDGLDALSLCEGGSLSPRHIVDAARTVAAFHDRTGLGAPAPYDAARWLARAREPLIECIRVLEGLALSAPGPEALARYREQLELRLAALAPALEARRRAGRAVDGHGDLRLDHLWFEPGRPPIFIDCVEFDPELRRIDAASEVAFMAMDLAHRGRAELGERFLGRYAAERDDFDLYRVVDFFIGYRALVRAKVAGIAAGDAGIGCAQQGAAGRSARAHFELAVRSARPRTGAALVLTCGSIGAGKSSAAEALADASGAVVIASDRVRRAIAPAAGDVPEARYRPEQVDRVYAALLERAAAVIDSGRAAILDATFGLGERRERAADWARRRDIPCELVQVGCPPKVALVRLEARQRQGSDPSEAGPDLLAASLRAFQPPVEWPAAHYHYLDTAAPDWRKRAQEIAGRWARPEDPS